METTLALLRFQPVPSEASPSPPWAVGSLLAGGVLEKGLPPGVSNLREHWHPLEGSQNPRLQGPTPEFLLQLVWGGT